MPVAVCRRARGRRGGLPEQAGKGDPSRPPDYRTELPGERSRPETTLHTAHTPAARRPPSPVPGTPAPSAGPAQSPPRRHVANQVCAARVPAVSLTRHAARARAPGPRLSGPGGEGRGCRHFPSPRVVPAHPPSPRRAPRRGEQQS